MTIIDINSRERIEEDLQAPKGEPLARALVNKTDDPAVEALARVLAMQSGLIRDPNSEQEFEKIPGAARHAMRELATQYADIVREVDELAEEE